MKRTHRVQNLKEKEVHVMQPKDTVIDDDHEQVIVKKSEEDTKRIIRKGLKTRRAKAVNKQTK